MSQKTIHHPVRSVLEYVRLTSDVLDLDLTDKELEIFAAFMELHLQLKHADLQTNAFSTDGRKIVAERLGRTKYTSLGPYIKRLKDKGAITKITGGYSIDPLLIPSGESEIIIKIRP